MSLPSDFLFFFFFFSSSNDDVWPNQISDDFQPAFYQAKPVTDRGESGLSLLPGPVQRAIVSQTSYRSPVKADRGESGLSLLPGPAQRATVSQTRYRSDSNIPSFMLPVSCPLKSEFLSMYIGLPCH